MINTATDGYTTSAKRQQQRKRVMDGMSVLPEHLQHEIFSRVGDVKPLFMFAATCRGWLRRFTEAAFLRELCPNRGSGHRARLSGVIMQDRCFNRYDKAMVQARMMTMTTPPQLRRASSALAPVFLPALGSPLGPAGRSLTSFVGGGDYDGTFDYAAPLAARCGIVLVRIAPRTPEEMMDMNHCRMLFGVCNLITGDRHVLPPLECIGDRRLTGYAIITAADDDSHSGNGRPHGAAAARFTFSQLLVITQDGEQWYSAVAGYQQHWYSATTRRWSAPTRCLDTSLFTLVGTTAAAMSGVVHRGAAHWLCVGNNDRPLYERAARYDDGDDRGLYRVSVEVATARVSLTRLPVRVGGGKPHLFVNTDGELAVASVYPFHVMCWTQPGRAGDDNDDTAPAAAAWPHTSFRIASQQSHHERWCNFNHGSLLAIFRGSGGVCILDLQTKVMEEAFMLDFDNRARFLAPSGATKCVTCVPYEMDLVDFFTLHLGGIRGGLSGTTTDT